MKIKQLLQGLSFKTGVIVLALCIPFYIISFAQMALSISTEMKGVLWVVFFGLAKTFQYGGLTILGVDGWKRLKAYFGNNKETE
jgi:phosphoglycolate phosphatase